jgi:hypothetical protein
LFFGVGSASVAAGAVLFHGFVYMAVMLYDVAESESRTFS